ncbi:MAG: tape measure protein, partial [Waterburya sp.]
IQGKGQVYAEELKQQLAESTPGAISALSEGLGISQKELFTQLENGDLSADKFMVAFSKGLNSRLEKINLNGADNINIQLNKLQAQTTKLQLSLGEAFAPLNRAIVGSGGMGLAALNGVIQLLIPAFQALQVVLITTTVVAAAKGTAAMFALARSLGVVGVVAKSTAAIQTFTNTLSNLPVVGGVVKSVLGNFKSLLGGIGWGAAIAGAALLGTHLFKLFTGTGNEQLNSTIGQLDKLNERLVKLGKIGRSTDISNTWKNYSEDVAKGMAALEDQDPDKLNKSFKKSIGDGYKSDNWLTNLGDTLAFPVGYVNDRIFGNKKQNSFAKMEVEGEGKRIRYASARASLAMPSILDGADESKVEKLSKLTNELASKKVKLKNLIDIGAPKGEIEEVRKQVDSLSNLEANIKVRYYTEDDLKEEIKARSALLAESELNLDKSGKMADGTFSEEAMKTLVAAAKLKYEIKQLQEAEEELAQQRRRNAAKTDFRDFVAQEDVGLEMKKSQIEVTSLNDEAGRIKNQSSLTSIENEYQRSATNIKKLEAEITATKEAISRKTTEVNKAINQDIANEITSILGQSTSSEDILKLSEKELTGLSGRLERGNASPKLQAAIQNLIKLKAEGRGLDVQTAQLNVQLAEQARIFDKLTPVAAKVTATYANLAQQLKRTRAERDAALVGDTSIGSETLSALQNANTLKDAVQDSEMIKNNIQEALASFSSVSAKTRKVLERDLGTSLETATAGDVARVNKTKGDIYGKEEKAGLELISEVDALRDRRNEYLGAEAQAKRSFYDLTVSLRDKGR